MPVPIRRLCLALAVCCALVAGGTACGSSNAGAHPSTKTAVTTVALNQPAAEPSPSTSAEKQKFAKTRFVANAGLAAGATYQWIYKPWKAGKFKKGAHGRKLALVKAGAAGLFTYNRLKAAERNAKGDPLLSKAIAPLSKSIESLKGLSTKLRHGDTGAAGGFNDVITNVKDAGKSAGAPVQNKVPSAGQLRSGQ
ncbi:hypothetical protein E2C11_07010 [Streptomyces lavendulae]|nr:hypothetical protein [Streptomyces lavendulae]TXJ84319.1 hypothetical protein E2C11_07010 [Streptomyces lavendulae]